MQSSAFPAAGAGKPDNKKKKRINSSSAQAVAMLAPTVLGFVLFTYVPIIYILRYAFYQSNGIK